MWKRHKDVDLRIASAKAAASAIAKLDLYEPHKRELLSICAWKATLAEGTSKYRTRFRSEAALQAANDQLAHDHVHERKKLVDEMLESPDEVDAILAKAVACTVTREEHSRLTEICREEPELDGWERYERLGIIVVDQATGKRGTRHDE